MTRVSVTARHQLPIDLFPRVQAVCLDSFAQAKYWLDDLINGEDFRRDGRRLVLESGIVIDSPQIDEVLATSTHEPIEDRYLLQNRRFRKHPWEHQPKADPVPSGEAKPATVQVQRPKRPDDYITVAEIAAQLGVKPFDIRQALRNSGAVKPDFGWAFDPNEVKTIKKLIGGK